MSVCSRFLLILTVLATAYALLVLGLLFPCLGLTLLVVALGLGAKSRQAALWAMGTARWANEQELRGLIDASTGVIIGRAHCPPPSKLTGVKALFNPRLRASAACSIFLSALRRKANPGLVRLPDAVHTAVFAPTGVGKGVSFVIPFLLTCRDSCVVIDFKGELVRETAAKRRAFGHRVIVLDPFRIAVRQPDTFNPLDWIDKDSPLSIDEARDLADAIVVRTGQEKEPHWNDSAATWISAMIIATIFYGEPGDRSLQTVRRLLTDPHHMEGAVKLLCASEACDGLVSRIGKQLTHFKDKELASVITTVNRHMRFLDTPAIFENSKSSSFDPSELRQGRMTIYLVLPPDHLRAQSGLLRLWIDSMFRAVVKGGLQEQNKVHFVLDEAASLGHLESIDDAVDKFRGYGIRLFFFYQSLGQLRKCFPDGQDQTLLSNVTQIFFGTNDPPTAEYVSTRLGEFTTTVTSGGEGSGGSQQHQEASASSTSSSWNSSNNWNQVGRKLLKPEEVLGLSARTAITFTPGVPPICTTVVRYFEEPRLGLQPTWWERTRSAAASLLLALLLFICSAVMAISLTAAKTTRPPSPGRGVGWSTGDGR